MNQLRYLWENFTSLGIQEGMSYPLQQRIKLSNHIGLVIGGVTTLFIVVAIFSRDFNAFFPVFALIAFSLSIPFLNALGIHSLSRFSISVAPALGTFALNLSIKLNSPDTIGLVHYITPRMFLVSSVAIPIIIFTSSEALYMVAALLCIMFLGTFGYEWAHTYYQISFEDLSIEHPYYSVMYEDIVLMLITLVGALSFFRHLNYQYETWTSNLLKEAREKNRELNEKEISLEKSLAEIKKTRIEDERRSWEAKGLALFANMLRSKMGEMHLYKNLIRELVHYVKANQGAIYLVNDQDEVPCLNIEAAYAFGKKQYYEDCIENGEGLLGQSLKDGNPKYIAEIPENYANIETGLGAIRPRSVLILPLKFQEQTEGVIELTFVRELEEYKKAFLYRLAENLGTIIASDKADRKTQVLLKNSRNVTEELRKNEEILRQSLTELEMSREKLSRKEKEYLIRIKQLEERLIIINKKSD